MCHPQLQKDCVQPHAFSTGGLQGHPKNCLLLANGMLGALDSCPRVHQYPWDASWVWGPVGLSPSPTTQAASPGTRPSTRQPWQWCVAGESPGVSPALHLCRHSPQWHPWAEGSPQGCPGAVPRLTAPPQPQNRKGSQSCPQPHKVGSLGLSATPPPQHSTGLHPGVQSCPRAVPNPAAPAQR